MDVKHIWTDADFDEMGWHDSRVYSLSFPDENFEFSLDIDYIFQWVQPTDISFQFWVSPCTLVFKDVTDLKVDIDFSNSITVSIIGIERSSVRMSQNGKAIIWKYIIETDKGILTFLSTGFRQYVRDNPSLSNSQDLGRTERYKKRDE